ncbi:hypothetical protein DC522_21340 [Microvirga sp. KLBC 81]|uniref:CYTH and CHAD domain-containing protein n=1 Tax=Microvirga sp. KLBC 81 TaxID=1862707 RepID=UPI000D514EDB|nr:CYTH and CHAD domain-containing protein [Microvirga sp. KLBC 81]PVE22430.1 hypothetical protein DC522_21340 [Microvirga sp. KLBC 81]
MDTLPRHQHAREIELKLELTSGAADAVLRHPLLARAKPLPEQSGQLYATYYDTTDHALRRTGLTLRVRRRNGHSIQTIKAEGDTRGLALDRGEWECPVENGIDFAAASGTPLAAIISDEAIRSRIAPAFIIETERQAFLIEHDNAVIELSLDRAKASAGSQNAGFCEVELELKKGDASALFSFACTLAESAPLRLSPITKSERGYDLIDGMAARPVLAGKIDLSPRTSCAEAFQIIARSCLSQVVRNEEIFRRTHDAEALHQMRVGFRRLNAAISLFKPMLTNRESRDVRDELRWAGKQLGPARDLDVLIASVHKPADVGAHAAELKRAERKRAKAYDKLFETLSSRRFMRIVLRAAAWIEAGRWLKRKNQSIAEMRQHPIEGQAVEELTRRWKPIRKRVKCIAEIEPQDLHVLRLRIKKLRYSSEFLEGVFRDRAQKPGRSWLATLRRLQDILGELNDISVGSSIMPALAKSDPERAERREKKLLSQAERAARNLRKSDPFWI